MLPRGLINTGDSQQKTAAFQATKKADSRTGQHSNTMQRMSSEHTPLWHFWQPRYWPLWIGLGLLRVIVLLPHKARMRLGAWLGKLTYIVAGSRANVAHKNIELCFPELTAEQQNALTRRHFESLGKTAIEMGMGWWAPDEDLNKLFVVEGEEHLDEVLRRDRGVILLCGHFPAVEISGRAMSGKMPPMAAMYRPNKNPLLGEFMRRSRSESISELISKDSVRQLLRALKNGTPVWYAPDQAYAGKGAILADFCGVPAMCNPATTQLLKTSKASLLPFLPSRLPDDSGYKILFLPPMDELPGEDPQTDTQAINDVFTGHIRRNPEQYYWVHRRFKGRPEPFTNPYDD